ncbi:MAG: MJ0042-type zinc finger domain-containing protein [Alphaproteobacteria bacterium]
MIITCPECASRFALQRESLGVTGRFVRCARCLHIWFQMPSDETEPTFAPNPTQNPVSGQLPSLSMDFKPRNRLWTTALMLSFVSMAILLVLVIKKEWISTTFPQTGAYYHMIL